MKKLIVFFSVLFGTCLGIGFIVSKLEKKKGWVESHKPYGIYEKHIKRPLDFALALLVLILLWPLFLIISVAVRIKMGSPIMFTQERPGLGGKIFRIYKFRTMTNEKDSDGNLLPDDKRLTKFGKFLRSTSLDEIGEIFNILKGDLSIVGPRPLLTKYLPYYTEEEQHRHDVRPGLTGYAQVHGRNNVRWEKRFEYDIKYTNKISLIEDFKIILVTIKVVFCRENIELNAVEDFDEYRKRDSNTNN